MRSAHVGSAAAAAAAAWLPLAARALEGAGRLLLVRPHEVSEGLARARAAGLPCAIPNEWQLTLGVARMWHRMVFRPESVGTGGGAPPRATWRARALALRPLRFPFLVAERAIAPLDFSGLRSSRERGVRHLLAAHHGCDEFIYDFELLELYPGALGELRDRALAIVSGESPRAAWLRDLCVFEGYHEALLAALEARAAAPKAPPPPAADPDTSFYAYLAWCARQPATPEATLAAALARDFTVSKGVAAAAQSGAA
ncbi:MAG: hypothetical protein IPF92_04345 [Myxococcales bacterium]|nr:hypothetical protein [Myxococcales bacterium]